MLLKSLWLLNKRYSQYDHPAFQYTAERDFLDIKGLI